MKNSNSRQDFTLDEMSAFSGVKKWLSEEEWEQFERILEKKNPIAFSRFKDAYTHPEKYL